MFFPMTGPAQVPKPTGLEATIGTGNLTSTGQMDPKCPLPVSVVVVVVVILDIKYLTDMYSTSVV